MGIEVPLVIITCYVYIVIVQLIVKRVENDATRDLSYILKETKTLMLVKIKTKITY